MKKILVVLIMCVTMMFCSIHVACAAAELWGVNFEFTNQDGDAVGSCVFR